MFLIVSVNLILCQYQRQVVMFMVNDFRGSPVISKVIKHCILDRYSDSQCGF